MDDNSLKQLVADTGRLLVDKKLVARTWGNISARKDAGHFAISPSGMAYDLITAGDVPIYDAVNKTYEGPRKPSSEKKIHAAMYEHFPDLDFVIHTHQDYATAVGLAGLKDLKLSDEEKGILGSIKVAAYGLPGTKKLKKAVIAALNEGGDTVLMIHHGVVVAGKDRDEAILKAETLENACKRHVSEKIGEHTAEARNISIDKTVSVYPGARLIDTPEMVALSNLGNIRPQLDDMAQMVGTVLKSVNTEDEALSVLAKQDAVLIKGAGCIVKADDPEDVDALELLLKKAAICRLYTDACGIKKILPAFDCALMHFVYKRKYSKKKGG